MTSRHLRGDDGASLVLALAFLALLGVFVTSLLSFGAVSFKNTVVTRNHEDQLYAADGGIEWGVQKLADPNVCPEGNSQGGLGSFTTQLNGKTVIVECSDTEFIEQTETGGGGGSSLLGRYGAILGDNNQGGITIGGGQTAVPSFLFKGDLYSEGSISVPSYTKLRIDGNLELKNQACTPSNVEFTSGHQCVPGQPVPNLPSPIPTVTIPNPAPPSVTIQTPQGPCTIFYPGRYGRESLAMSLQSNGRHYLASGNYYFWDAGGLNFQGQVFGGAPASTDQKLLTTTPCATDADAVAQRPSFTPIGKGVTIILGGNSEFRVQPGARVELFTREAPESGTTPGVTIWSRTDTQFTNGGTYHKQIGTTGLNLESQPNTVVLHGLTYLPKLEAKVKDPRNLDAGGASLFAGGLLAKQLSVRTEGNYGANPGVSTLAGGEVTSTTVKVPTKTVLRATATGTASSEVVTAVIDRTTNPPTIRSWRPGSAT